MVNIVQERVSKFIACIIEVCIVMFVGGRITDLHLG
jgi:hypothetical protein